MADRPEREDPERLADELQQEADRLERESTELGDELESVRDDWERKRADQAVPGANPPDPEDGDDEA
jgi:hypothetical protein